MNTFCRMIQSRIRIDDNSFQHTITATGCILLTESSQRCILICILYQDKIRDTVPQGISAFQSMIVDSYRSIEARIFTIFKVQTYFMKAYFDRTSYLASTTSTVQCTSSDLLPIRPSRLSLLLDPTSEWRVVLATAYRGLSMCCVDDCGHEPCQICERNTRPVSDRPIIWKYQFADLLICRSQRWIQSWQHIQSFIHH